MGPRLVCGVRLGKEMTDTSYVVPDEIYEWSATPFKTVQTRELKLSAKIEDVVRAIEVYGRTPNGIIITRFQVTPNIGLWSMSLPTQNLGILEMNSVLVARRIDERQTD